MAVTLMANDLRACNVAVGTDSRCLRRWPALRRYVVICLSSLTAIVMATEVAAETSQREAIESKDIREEYCTSERMNLHCNAAMNQVILVRRAVYGRLRPGRCITSDYAHALGCYSDVTAYIDAACSGHAECSLLVATVDSIAQPCPKDFKSYLEVTIRCITVSYIDDCTDLKSNTTLLTKPYGYLALFPRTLQFASRDPPSTDTVAVELRTCPWIIGTDPGRKINVSWQVASPGGANGGSGHGGISLPGLPNLASIDAKDSSQQQQQQQQKSGTTGALSGRPSCGVTLSFTEPGSIDNSPIRVTCSTPRSGTGGVPQAPAVYVSRSNQLRIDPIDLGLRSFHFTTTTQPNNGHLHDVTDYIQHDAWRPYILHYRAFGCSSVIPPDGATVTQYGDDVAVTCNQSQEVFYVTCSADNVWVGEVGNCSNRVVNKSYRSSSSSNSHLDSDVKTGVVVVIAIGVLLGIISGGFMLIIIFLIRRRIHHRQATVKFDARRKVSHGFNCDYEAFMQCTTGQLPVSLAGSMRPPTSTCQYCPCPHCRDVTSADVAHAARIDESSSSSPVFELGHFDLGGPCLRRARGEFARTRHELEIHLREILPGVVDDRNLNRPPCQTSGAPLLAPPASRDGCGPRCTTASPLRPRSSVTTGLLSAADEHDGRQETVYCTAVVSSTMNRDGVVIPAALGPSMRSPSHRAAAAVGMVTSCS